MKLKKLIFMVLASLFITVIMNPGISAEGDKSSSQPGLSWEDEDGPSPPISRGTINTFTDIYWGKSELFPVLATVFHPTQLDVYEYDKDWVMVLYDTTLYVGSDVYDYSFYGFVKRSEITCDPKLEGDSSPKAKTSPNKRAKKPKKKQTDVPTESTTAEETKETTVPSESIPVDKLEESDWIIRTPGLQEKTIRYEISDIVYRFNLTAEKFGGVAASSDPRFNNGKRNPYAVVGFFSMESNMQNVLDNMGIGSFASGTGGASVEGQASGAKMYIDTGADDFALVNLSLMFNMTTKFGATVDAQEGEIKAQLKDTTTSSVAPLNMQLKKSGGGYEIILKGIAPDGKDVSFPALLEKFPSDQDRRDAQDADKRRQAAEDKINKQLEDMRKKEAQAKENQDPLETLVPEDDNSDPLETLVPDEGSPDPLETLVPDEGSPDPLETLVPPDGDDALAPLEPQDGDTATGFPDPR